MEGLTDESKEEDKEEEEEQSAVVPKESKKICLSLQLSSPIEEGVLSEIFDPELQDDVPETMKVTFRGVETNQATLTLTATDVSGINSSTSETPLLLLGTSESIDLSSMTKLDVINPTKLEYITDLPVAIYPEAKEGDEQTTTPPPPPAASCTVTIRLTFVPSQKDVLEELYELLNKATTRKTRAVDKLRQIAAMASRQSAQQQLTTRQQQQQQQPAVRAGFLNKPTTPMIKKEPSKLQVFYERYLGPQTQWRQMLPLAKNYIIFFVAVSAMHFKGHNLALPPPV